jgi:predicted permease
MLTHGGSVDLLNATGRRNVIVGIMDIRYAFRMLAKTPGFTLMAVITLALGIGLNTVVFTVYESVALKPLAVRSPAEIVRIAGRYDGPPVEAFSYQEYEQFRDHSRSFASVVATSTPQTILCALPGAKPDQTQTVLARLVSTNYFEALGVNPAIGRAFGPSELAMAVVSHSFWKRRLQEDPSVVGKDLTVQGTPFVIVGVAPETFAGTGLPPQSPDLWIPLAMQPSVLPGVDWLHDRTAREFQILARRKAGVSIEQASSELDVLGRLWPPVENKQIRLRAKPATFFQTDTGEFETFGQVSAILMVAVALIMLIGCVNLVNLLLARGAARQSEIAVRLAVGASGPRIVRQLCTESGLIGVLGGAMGLLLSLWSCQWIGVSLAGALQRISNGALSLSLDLTPDWRVFAYTVVLSVLTGVAVGLWPAIRASRTDLTYALKQESTGMGGARGRRWSSRNMLLTAQVAGCLVLLAGAGLLFRGVRFARMADPGFDTKHVFMLGVNAKTLAATPASRTALLGRAMEQVQTLPEVASAAWVERPPFLGHGSTSMQSDAETRANCLFNHVSERYFETLGIPILAGRVFTKAEVERSEAVIVVSESAARQFWPGQDAIGRRILADGWFKRIVKHDSFTVIGIVKSVRSTYLSKMDSGFVYFPEAPPSSFGTLLVRTRTAPEAAFRPAFAALSAVHSNLPSQTFMLSLEQGPMEIQKLMSEAPALVASLLGLLALLLASVGVFGVVSYLVTQRTREIGVHIALGAQNRDVIRMVLGQSLRPAAWGAVIGLIGAIGLSGLLTAMVALPDVPDLTYGAGAVDPVTFLGVLAVLTMVVLAASFMPVRRATRVEPAVALRDE